jgi:hypothetical protein
MALNQNRVILPNKLESQQWRGKEYWQRALPDMRKAYNSICSAFWIPHSTGYDALELLEQVLITI